jgi:transposase
MTFNQHVRLVVGAELKALHRRGLTDAVDAAQALPKLLYVHADGRQLRDAVTDGAWPAPDARCAGDAALDAYALPLLRAFIDSRRARVPETPQYRFGAELARDIHPVGTWFERYLVRMFEGAGSAPYALGLRTADLDMAARGAQRRRTFHVASAIYDAARQRAMLDTIYTAFETCHAQACTRFGPGSAEQVTAACWDALRQAVGGVLHRFRPPHLAAEREWVATAYWQAPTRFLLDGDLLVPALSLRAHAAAAYGLPIERTLVHAGPAQQLAAEGLRHFYRFHGLPARVIAAGA